MESFAAWLDNQLTTRNWKQADLARAANLSTAVVSNIINEKRNVGEITAKAIAKALRLPEEEVFRAAGILRQKPDPDHEPGLGEWIELYRAASADQKELMLENARWLSQRKTRNAK